MYHEEKVINGILHFRSTPNGEFKEMSLEQMTDKLLRLGNNGTLMERKLKEVCKEIISEFEDHSVLMNTPIAYHHKFNRLKKLINDE